MSTSSDAVTEDERAPEREAAIEVRGLVKRFGAVRALDGLDLTVQCGEAGSSVRTGPVAWPAAFLTLVIVGELLELPSWIIHLSPYSHVPTLPAASWSWGAELSLTAAAVLLVLVAGRRFGARDVG
jgi:putative exporter of polyketide antibiotics